MNQRAQLPQAWHVDCSAFRFSPRRWACSASIFSERASLAKVFTVNELTTKMR